MSLVAVTLRVLTGEIAVIGLSVTPGCRRESVKTAASLTLFKAKLAS